MVGGGGGGLRKTTDGDFAIIPLKAHRFNPPDDEWGGPQPISLSFAEKERQPLR